MDRLQSVPAAWRWLATLAMVVVVVVLSITPGVQSDSDSAFVWLVVNTATPVQKAMHVAIYMTLAVLWYWSLERVRSRALRALLTISATVGLGAILEWHQTRVPGRFGTLMDIVLNAIGALAGVVLAALLL